MGKQLRSKDITVKKSESLLREIRNVLARHKKAVRNGRIVIDLPANLVKKYEF